MDSNKITLWFFFLLLAFSGIIISCDGGDDEDLAGNWSELSDFEGIPRSDAVGFSIEGKAYVGTGYDGKDDEGLNDFYEYNPDLDNWTQKADVPGPARNGAVGFAVGNKGYIGTGYDNENEIALSDFWEYDVDKNTWSPKADFLGSARYGAVAFAIGDTGYVGTGYDEDNDLKDFYCYSPSSNSWRLILSIGGKRRDAAAFVINGKGYVVTGYDNSYENDMWEYDPSTGRWTEKRKISNVSDDDYDNDYTTISRVNGVGFAINGKGYIVGGSTSTMAANVWEYHPTTDLWVERTSFEGTERTEAVGFAIGNYGYITTGRSSSSYFDDTWRFDPNAEQVDND